MLALYSHLVSPYDSKYRLSSDMPCREDQKSDNAYLHATLQQIDHLANEDVEMQVKLFVLGILTSKPLIMRMAAVVCFFPGASF